MWKKILLDVIVSICSTQLVLPAYALEKFIPLNNLPAASGQSEFINSNKQNRLLIEVNMLSGVGKKGIHQVPDNTNLVEMVSLAGGPEEKADLSEVHVKRKMGGGFKTLGYDLERLVEKPGQPYPVLEDGDVIMIERESQFWSQALNIFGVVAGLVISGFVINNELKR